MDNVKFVMAGSGDLMCQTIEMAAELGIGSKVLFAGFLRGEDVQKMDQMADLFVMPSVSEPFGLVPLEALNNDVPALKITLQNHSNFEVRKLRWKDCAAKYTRIYKETLAMA